MKVVLATGGTGGHLLPALKLAEELKKDNNEIIFLGSFGKNVEQIKRSGFQIESVQARGLRFISFKDTMGSFFSNMKASFLALKLLKGIKPDVVCGFGGYGAFPVMVTAIFLRIPTLIHEQNVIPGRANAILAKFVRKVAVSFRPSIKHFKEAKTVLTGCPCHHLASKLNKDEVLKRFGLEGNRITILVFGGSQGSHRINEVFLKTAQTLKDHLNFQVIHISGENDYDKLKDGYSKLGIPYALFKYLEEMASAYSVVDLVISRAGAVTVTEIANFQLPAILIPYPYAQGGHQKENALMLSEAKLARVIEEKDLTSTKLQEEIIKQSSWKSKHQEMQKHFEDICVPNPTQRLAFEVFELAK